MCLQAAWRTTHSRASGCRRVEDSDFGRNDSLEMPGGLRPPLQALCIRQKTTPAEVPSKLRELLGEVSDYPNLKSNQRALRLHAITR